MYTGNSRSSLVIAVMVAVLLITTMTVSADEVIFSISDSFAAGDTVDGDNLYRDTYQVRVQAGTTVEVVCYSDTIDTYIEAVLPNGERISNDDYQGYNAGFLRTVDTTGTMEFTVSPVFGGETGPYRITVTELAPAPRISVGDKLRGRIGTGPDQGLTARYEYQGTPGERVIIDLKSDDFDAFLRVIDSSGREFADDDGGGGLNSRLGYQFDEAGAIQIIAGTLGGDQYGAFEISMSESPNKIAAEYRGTLDVTDRRAYDGTLYDSYEYTGKAGSLLSVALESDDFDTMLYISYPDGSNLAQDDDGGGGSNSRLDVTLPENGIYTMYVVSFFEETGAYRLTVYE